MERFGKDGKIRIAGKELTFKDPVPEKIEYGDVNGKYQSYWDFLKKVEEEFEDLEFSFTKLYTSGYVVLSSSEFREGAKDDEEEKVLVPINVGSLSSKSSIKLNKKQYHSIFLSLNSSKV